MKFEGETKIEHTTILKPSATSAKSLAALTRFLAFNVLNLRSNSGITVSHCSPTSVSRMVSARFGEIVRSLRRLDNGFSIFCEREHEFHEMGN